MGSEPGKDFDDMSNKPRNYDLDNGNPTNTYYEDPKCETAQAVDFPESYLGYAQTCEWNASLELASITDSPFHAATPLLSPAYVSSLQTTTPDSYAVHHLHPNSWRDIDSSTSVSSTAAHVSLQNNVADHYDHFMEESGPHEASPASSGSTSQDASFTPSNIAVHDCIINGERLVTATYNYEEDFPYSTMSISCIRDLGIRELPIPRSRRMTIHTPLGEKRPSTFCMLRCDINDLEVTDCEMSVQLLDTNDATYDRHLHLGRNVWQTFGMQ